MGSRLLALLALFVALGGVSYAAIKLPAGSVGGKQLKDSAVTSAKVKNGALVAKDFRAGQLPAGLPGARGADGAQGPAGPPGATGPRGPSDVWTSYAGSVAANLNNTDVLVFSSELPDGDYLAFANAVVSNHTPGTVTVHCRLISSTLWPDDYAADISDLVLGPGETKNLVLSGPYSLPATPQNYDEVAIMCDRPSPQPASGSVNYNDIDLEMLRVAAMH